MYMFLHFGQAVLTATGSDLWNWAKVKTRITVEIWEKWGARHMGEMGRVGGEIRYLFWAKVSWWRPAAVDNFRVLVSMSGTRSETGLRHPPPPPLTHSPYPPTQASDAYTLHTGT